MAKKRATKSRVGRGRRKGADLSYKALAKSAKKHGGVATLL